jgi:hypothetical protein
MTDLDLSAMLTRSEQAQKAVSRSGLPLYVPPVVGEHFNYDVPALIGAIKRLTAQLEQCRDAMFDQHDEVGHVLAIHDCLECLTALDKGDSAYACADSKRRQATYMAALAGRD